MDSRQSKIRQGGCEMIDRGSDRRQMGTVLVLGGTGKTGRRVVERLAARDVPVRVGSRTGTPPFDWDDRSTWEPALRGVASVYVAYQPDLAVPEAPPAIRALIDLAEQAGVQRMVLLSGRGEEAAQACERLVQESRLRWTIVRASWFAQNFSASFLLDLVLGGEVALPVGDVAEPFVDTGDIADVAVAALTEDGHDGELYEVTGPRLLTFAQAIAEIAHASGRDLRFVRVPADAFSAALAEQQVPADVIALMMYLFTTVLDGRNAYLTDGVQRALGRAPRDFAEYARAAAARGVWRSGGDGGAAPADRPRAVES
jgi:uncharacterized protein YbjT (DUF2867 family)